VAQGNDPGRRLAASRTQSAYRLVRPYPPSQGEDLFLFQLHEEPVITHPAIAFNAANETVAVVVNLDERAIAVRAAFIHRPISLRTQCCSGRLEPLTQNL
jgi:hypothetical protein